MAAKERTDRKGIETRTLRLLASRTLLPLAAMAVAAFLFSLAPNAFADDTNTVDQAELLFRAGKYAEAMPVFQRQLVTAGDADAAGRGLFHIGQCLTASRRYSEAVAAFDNLVAKFPTSSWTDDALLRKGAVQAGFLKNSAAGISTWRELIKKYPTSERVPEAYFYIGAVQWTKGQRSSAREAFRVLVRDHAQSPFGAQARLYLNP